MLKRTVVACGSRKVRLGTKDNIEEKKRYMLFDGDYWQCPGGAKIVDGFVWCQIVEYESYNGNVCKYMVNIGSIEIPDKRNE